MNTDLTQSDRAHQRTLTQVALDILRKRPGDRITTSLDMQERLNVGSGTVQKAIRQLTDVGAVRLKVKGHQGTVILEQDAVMLWKCADLGPLRLTLTPPGSIELTALAIELRGQLAERHITTELDFVRGARNRIQLLETNFPRVVALSSVAAKVAGVTNNIRYSNLDLGPHTYYRPETLVVLEGRDADQHKSRRVARDSESNDHSYLTALQFPERDGYEYVECPFPEVPAAILTGKADTGVWHQVVSAISPEQAGLRVTRLDWEAKSLDASSITRGMLVWRSEYAEIAAILRFLDIQAISKEQDRLTALGINSSDVRESVPWL